MAEFFYIAVAGVALMAIVWHWRREMAAWLTAMVPADGFARQLKLDIARNWWIGGLVFYGLMGAAELYGELTGNDSRAARPRRDRRCADGAPAVRDADAPDHPAHRV